MTSWGDCFVLELCEECTASASKTCSASVILMYAATAHLVLQVHAVNPRSLSGVYQTQICNAPGAALITVVVASGDRSMSCGGDRKHVCELHALHYCTETGIGMHALQPPLRAEALSSWVSR
jgi:hypothetical protein